MMPELRHDSLKQQTPESQIFKNEIKGSHKCNEETSMVFG